MQVTSEIEMADSSVSLRQELDWSFDQSHHGVPAANISVASRIEGELNVNVLMEALNTVVNRHELLRAVFCAVDGFVRCRVIPELSVEWSNEVLIAADWESTSTEVIAEREAARPFNLSTGPMIRAKVITLSRTSHILVLTSHEIVSDRASISLLLNELWTIYSCSLSGNEVSLPAPPSYIDFAREQRKSYSDGLLDNQLHYWRETLWENPVVLNLPVDRTKSAISTYRSISTSFLVSPEVSTKLRNLGVEESVGISEVLLTAYFILLHRNGGDQDIRLGITTDVGIRPTGMIGPLNSGIALRLTIAEEDSFLQLLGRARAAMQEAQKHDDVPIEMAIPSSSSQAVYTPILQAMLVLDEETSERIEVSGLKIFPMSIRTGFSRFDITLRLSVSLGGIVGTLEGSLDNFDEETVSRLASQYQVLLGGIVEAPFARAGDLPLLSEQEAHQLAVEWNSTTSEFPEVSRLHELFEEQAEKTPDATAVIYEKERLTYRQLNSRANRLARRLQRAQLTNQELVGLFANRSLELVIAVLAILKAGGAYIPLDPVYPRDRLAFMLKDAQPRFVLTTSRLLDELPDGVSNVLCIDDEAAENFDDVDEDIVTEGHASDLAYVLYTSGSTGKPKGVLIQHNSVVNLLIAMQEFPGMTANDTLLSVTSFSFDIAALEIFLPLITGATVVIANQETVSDPGKLAATLRLSKPTLMQATPTTWRMLIERGDLSGISYLKALCGGEALAPDLAEQLLARGFDLWNLYGPTETTIWSSRYHVSSLERKISIGRPISNTQMYVLDQRRNLVPVGVPGELYIGGTGVARGYLNRPELTLERFVPNPFSDTDGARIYRTGDLARTHPDGTFEYLGRIDNQIKIRGYRIELGEIEASLLEAEEIAQAVVVAVGDRPEGKQLVAYLIPAAGQELNVGEVRLQLERALPKYMIPQAFVVLDKFPLTPNGKIDRKSLPAPAKDRLIISPYAPPSTPIEVKLVSIWKEVLGVSKIGIHDTFHELGGHSLLAIKVLFQVSRAFNVEIPTRFMFETPTIADLAIAVQALQRDVSEPQCLPIQVLSTNAFGATTYSQERIWRIDKRNPADSRFNLIFAIALIGPLDVTALEVAINRVLSSHDAFQVNIRGIKNAVRMFYSRHKYRSIPLIELPIESDSHNLDSAIDAIQQDAEDAFYLSNGPLYRVKLYRCDQETHVLSFICHHLIIDAQSEEIFWQDVATCYEQVANNNRRIKPLLNRPSFVQFANRQHAMSDSPEAEVCVRYWQQTLAGSSATQLFCQSHDNGQGYIPETIEFLCEKELCNELDHASGKHNVSLFVFLLAALKFSLYEQTGADTLVVGSPVSGRNWPGTEDMIGFLSDTILIKSTAPGGNSFAQFLEGVREKCLEAFSHQMMPFPYLMSRLQPELGMSYVPPYQVRFIFNRSPFQKVRVGDLDIVPLRIKTGRVAPKIDLAMYLEHDGESITGRLIYDINTVGHEVANLILNRFREILNSSRVQVEHGGRH